MGDGQLLTHVGSKLLNKNTVPIKRWLVKRRLRPVSLKSFHPQFTFDENFVLLWFNYVHQIATIYLHIPRQISWNLSIMWPSLYIKMQISGELNLSRVLKIVSEMDSCRQIACSMELMQQARHHNCAPAGWLGWRAAINKVRVTYNFSCDQAAQQMVFSVRLFVRPSVTPFYPRPVLAFGYCRCLRLSVCVCVRPCVNYELVRAITHHPFQLGSPNLDQRCKRPWLRSLLFCGMIDHDLQGQIELQSQNLPHFELVHTITHHQLKLQFPNLEQKCILTLFRSLPILGLIEIDLQFNF